jgi:hypothetical protein
VLQQQNARRRRGNDINSAKRHGDGHVGIHLPQRHIDNPWIGEMGDVNRHDHLRVSFVSTQLPTVVDDIEVLLRL